MTLTSLTKIDRDRRRVLACSIATDSRLPLIGSIQLTTADGLRSFTIDEEMAHAIRAKLEHFLSQ